MSIPDQKQPIVDYVSRYGNAASDALLDPNCQIFRIPSIEGVIGYRIVSRYAVAFGDPVCPLADRVNLAQAFHSYCQEQGLRVLYLVASEEFTNAMRQMQLCKMWIEVAHILILNPQKDPKQDSLARRNIQHAVKEGVIANEYLPLDLTLEQEMEEAGRIWVKARKGIQTYLSHVYLFDNRTGRRWFYARQGQRLVGVLMLNQVENGWLLNHLISLPDAPRGVSELLVATALEQLAKEGCPFFIAGVVPKQEAGEIEGLSKMMSSLLRYGYKLAMKFLRLKGRERYWEKFHPENKRAFLAFSHSHFGVREIRALIQAIDA